MVADFLRIWLSGMSHELFSFFGLATLCQAFSTAAQTLLFMVTVPFS
jgi:hypothetical protein